jgi:hypothetical protein
MNNDVLFENDKVSVNAAFFNAGTAQFPIRNIGSIHVVPESPSRQLPLLLLGLSFLVMMGASVSHQGMGTFIGLLMLAGSIWWLVSQKPVHWIQVVSSGATTKAHSSKDLEEIKQIQQAINVAIAQLNA